MQRTYRVAAFAAVGILLAGLGKMVQGAPSIGRTAPALKVSTLAGQAFDLSTMRGQVVIVNFWATWCSPCHAEMPVLSEFYRRHHDQGLEMIGLSADQPRDRKDVRKAALAVSYPVVLAGDAKANGFGVSDKLPVTYVVDGGGVLRAVFSDKDGLLTAKWLKDKVVPLLPDRRQP